MSDSFVHLHLHSQYSLLDGAIKFDELADWAHESNMPAVALTDHGNMFGAYEFYEKAKKANVKPIIGCEIYITPTLKLEKPSDGKNFHLTVLCMNDAGYKNLSNLVTKGYFEGFYRRPRIDHQILSDHSEGLIVLSGCLNSEISRALFSKDNKKALSLASMYKEIFGDRYYLEVQATGLKEQNLINGKLKDIGKKLNIPLVATNDCHFLKRADAKPHDALLCIQTGSAVKEEKRFRFQGDDFFVKSRDEMENDLKGFDEAIKETLKIAERCSFEFKTDGYKFPEYTPPDGRSLDEFMCDLSRKTLLERLKENEIPESEHEVYKERLESELKIICDMGFSGYFLVVSDFIYYAKKNGIPVGPGRGSAAGSLVAYALGITEVDPIPYNLIFERFLNPERVSMPDIDVDFCTEGRDEVIRYVTEKYGKDKVAQIGTFGTMSAKAVVKDVGRVLGIPYAEVDKVSKLIPSFRGKVFSINEAIEQVKEIKELIKNSSDLQELIELAKPLENMVRHSSTHAAGVVIANEPIADYIPLYRGSKDETVTQFDMNCIEKLGYVKFDFLGLKTLTVIDKAVKHIWQNHQNGGERFNINKIPLDDKEVYKVLTKGLTRGVFQIESSGMKDLMSRLQPTKFDDVVAVLALYRPGPLDSGMVDQFIDRKHGKKVVYPHPALKEILDDTYGLFVYQEQIMKTASEIAGYSLGEADLLRRAMGKKKPAEMRAQRKRFLSGAKENGVDDKKAKELFDTMEKFAEYSFNKSHSTAYALITYQTAYLKTHYPAEFMAALMTVEANNTDKVISSITECRKHGIEVLAPDVNVSMSGFTPADGKIRFGLSAIKNVGEGTVEAILKTRDEVGKFETVFDFCTRIESRRLNRRTLESLIRCGAFDSINNNRAQLFESLDNLITYSSLKQKSEIEGQHALFEISESVSAPVLEDVENWDEQTILSNELDVLGFYVSTHPMRKYANELKKYTSKVDSESIHNIRDRQNVTIAGVVRSLDIKHTKRGNGILGNLVLEDLNGFVEGVIFNDTLRKSMAVLEQKVEPIIVKGIAERNEDKVKIKVTDIFSLRQMRTSSSIQIKVKECHANSEMFKNLKEVLEKFPGESKVMLQLNTENSISVVEVGNCKVGMEDNFIKNVENLLGKNVVSLA